MCTYKVILSSQPLGAVLLQKPLEQVPACIRHVGLEHRSLVQDVTVHLSRVATVEWRLFQKKEGVVLILYKQSGDLKRHKVTGFHLQVHRAFHRAPIPGTTSRQCGHTPASGEPQEPNTEKKNREKFNASLTLFLRSRTEVILMMNKCLKMYLLPQASHRRLSWYRWPQGLLCRGQSLLGQCGPVSLTGCSLASGPCQKQDKEMFTLNASGHRFTDVH